jgi:hypothetical protein
MLRLALVSVFAVVMAGCHLLFPFDHRGPHVATDACCAAPDAVIDGGSVDVAVSEAAPADASAAEALPVVDLNPGDMPGDVESVPGDLNGDGKVDGDDYLLIQAAFGTCKGDASYLVAADYDGDNCITFSDYQIWYALYKKTLSDGGVD